MQKVKEYIEYIPGFVLAIVIPFFPKSAAYLSPIYSFAQGVVLSSISCYFEAQYPGIVIKAVSFGHSLTSVACLP